MRYLRRTVQALALVGTLLVGIIALALIVSQTPWFRDWLRRFAVDQAKQYVNGDLSIGSLGGNLFYGVQLGDVTLDINGEHVITLKRLEIKYSIADLMSHVRLVRTIRLDEPFVLLRRDESGWNVARLVKRQRQEANRQGPMRPLSLPGIEIVNGRVAIDDRAPSPSYTLPSRIDALNSKGAFFYEPVHFSVTVENLSFAGKAPDLTLSKLTGAFATRDDNLNVQKLFLQTADSSVTVDGVVRQYLSAPSLQLTVAAPRLSLPEWGAVLPPVRGYALHPEFDVKADGPLDQLKLALNTRSEAGTISGTVTADLRPPDLGVRGNVSVQRLNLAPILKNPAQRSDITGRATLDVVQRSAPASAAAIDRLRARVVFDGPSVTTFGYTAANVHATASVTGRRIAIDSRASAYGGSATAKGTIVTAPPGQATTIDLAGQAAHVSLASLPAQVHAPRIATDLNATAYHVSGSFARSSSVDADTTLAQSTLAGGTILDGTKAHVSLTSTTGVPGLESLNYTAKGEVKDVNLRRVGEAFEIAALSTSAYDSRIHTTFDVTGSGATTDRMKIDADGTLAQSTLVGGTIFDGTKAHASLTFRTGEPGLESLNYTAKGEVKDVNLRHVGEAFEIAALSTPEYDSRIHTTFDVTGSGATADHLQIDATGTATNSEVFGGTIPHVDYEAHLANSSLRTRANGEFHNFDPARLLDNPRMKGNVSGTVDASFGMADTSAPITPDAITLDGRVVLTKSDLADVHIDNADVEGQYANRSGVLRQATVKGADLDVQASGPIDLRQTGESNVKLHVVSTNIETVGKLVNQPISGAATLDGTLTGNGSSLKASGTLGGSNLTYQNDQALDLNTNFTATVPNLEMARAQVQAEATGRLVQISGIQLDTIKAHAGYADQKLDFQTHLAQGPAAGQLDAAAGQSGDGSRQLDANGTLIFHPDHQEIHLPSLAFQTQGVLWQTAPGSAAAVQYGNDRINVDHLHLVNGQQSLDVNGAFSLGDNPIAGGITVTAHQIDVSQLEKLALMNRGFAGTLDLNATIAGTAKTPDVTAHGSVTNGAFRNFKYESLTADATYRDDRIVLDTRLVQAPGVELMAAGTVPMTALRPNPPGVTGHVEPAPGQGIDVRVHSTSIDLGIVQAFTNQLTNVTGTVQADFRVTGSGYDPHLNGYVDIQNGAFGVVAAGTRYSGLTTRIELQPEEIRIPRLQILDQHGSPMTIEGALAVHEGEAAAVNITAQANDFKLLDNELGKLGVDADMRLTGDERQPRIDGEVRLLAARLELDRVLMLFAPTYATEALPDVVRASETTTSDKGADEATRDALAKGRLVGAQIAPVPGLPPIPVPQAGLFPALQMNVNIVAPDDFVVRGTNLRPGGPTAAQVGNVNVTVGTNVRVQKNQNGPLTVIGTVNTVRGFYEFQGRRFTVQRDGTLRFRGRAQIDPDVDVTAERLIPNTGVTARIRVTGTARVPKLALSSDPPLDEADILSLIVFNRSVNDLGTGERASLADTASGIASGFLASSLSRSIGRSLDVDLFEITTTDPQTGETAGGVTLGKQVTEQMFVKFQQQFGQRSFTQFMMEYQLARFLRIDLEGAPESSGVANLLTQRRVERAGIDLIFFFSY